MDNTSVIAAMYGAVFVNNTSTTVTEDYELIEVMEAAVFTDAMRMSNTDGDARAEVLKGDVGGTVPAGTILRPPNGKYFTAIRISSGSYNAVVKGV